VVTLLSGDQTRDLYRDVLDQPHAQLVAIEFGLSCPPSSTLPQLGVQHLVRLLQLRGAATADAVSSLVGANVLRLLLSHSSWCLVALLSSCPPLFALLLRRVAIAFNSASAATRRSSVGPGSLAHTLALLVAEQLYVHALALLEHAHATAPTDAPTDSPMRALKSLLQHAKQTAQGQRDAAATAATSSTSTHADHANQRTDHDSLAALDQQLHLYRAALSTLLMDDFAA
jgi:hypothetical protein